MPGCTACRVHIGEVSRGSVELADSHPANLSTKRKEVPQARPAGSKGSNPEGPDRSELPQICRSYVSLSPRSFSASGRPCWAVGATGGSLSAKLSFVELGVSSLGGEKPLV